MAPKGQRRILSIRQKNLVDHQYRNRGSSGLGTSEVHEKSKSGNPYSNDDSLSCRKKMSANDGQKMSLVQALKTDEQLKRKRFCIGVQDKLEEVEFEKRFVFSEKATFHAYGELTFWDSYPFFSRFFIENIDILHILQPLVNFGYCCRIHVSVFQLFTDFGNKQPYNFQEANNLCITMLCL